MTAPTSAPAACTLPAAHLVGDVRLRRDGRVDGLAERALVGHDRQPARGDDLVRPALAGEHAVDDLAGEARGQGALGDQRDHAGDLRGGDRQLGRLDAGARWPPAPAGPATSCGPRRRGAPASTVASTRSSTPGVDHRLARRGRTAPSWSTSRAPDDGRRLRQRGPQLVHPRRVGRDGHEVGLREVPVVGRLLLRAARAGGAGGLGEVPRLLHDPLPGTQQGRPGAPPPSGPPARPTAAS